MHARRTSSAGIGVLVCLLAAFGHPAQADQLTLDAVKDSTLHEEDDTTANGAGEYFFAGNTDGGDTRRALIAFDLGSVPAGSTITDATLTLRMSRTQAGNITCTLHRVLAGWTEGSSNPGGQEGGGDSAELDDATWRYRSYDPNDEAGSPQWSSLGGDYVSGNSASTTVGGNGFYSWNNAQMAGDIQGWLNVPSTNHGWMLRCSESGQKTAKRFDSRQNGTISRRPELTVDFTPPVVTDGACCLPGESCQIVASITDCNNLGGTFQGEGTVCPPDAGAVVCMDPIGACCATGSPWACTETSEYNCSTIGSGVYQGDGSTCAPIDAAGGCPVQLTPFVDPLPIPLPGAPAFGTSGGTGTYHILVQERQQQLHDELPPTTVWGYGAAPAAIDPTVTYATYPGPTIEVTKDQPITVRYFNQLRDTSLGGSPPPLRADHYLNVDTCAHGAADQSPRIVTHVHGSHVPAASDGYPEDTFLPGEEARICVNDPKRACTSDTECVPPGGLCDGDGSACTNDIDCIGNGGAENCLLCEPGYVYPNRQQAASLWYHDHALGITRLNVYMGMAGLFIVRDAVEAGLNLPSPWPQAGDPPGMTYYEIPMVIQDRTFRAVDPLGGLRYPDGWTESFFGDTVLVNGKVWPYLDVDQGKYRFRLYNGSNSRRYILSLDQLGVGGTQDLPFEVIGVDGGLLETPVTAMQLTMGPAERYDVIVDFGALSAGTEIVMTNSDVPPAGALPDVMKFVVQGNSGFTGAIPAGLATVEPLDPADAVRTRQFLLRKGTEPCAGSRWEIRTLNEDGTVIGSVWDDITEYPQLGTVEIWEFLNPTVIPHPMHMHLVFFQILNRQEFQIVNDQIQLIGDPIPPGDEERGWKDTARTEPGQILRVIARFEDYEGLYAYHCHILEHEDHEMMRQFRTVQGVTLSAADTTFNWASIAGATGYDVVRGSIGALHSPVPGDYAVATQSCVVDGQPVNSYVHLLDNPTTGEGFWYLSRNRDAVGNGTYDSGSSGQVGLRDGGIAASGNDCD